MSVNFRGTKVDTELRAVIERIEANPDAFNMHHFCGDQVCIAGTLCLLHGWKEARGAWGASQVVKDGEIPTHAERVARNILRIDIDQAQRLFYLDKWPNVFSSMYLNHGLLDRQRSALKVHQAVVAVVRIRHFIEKGE